MKTSEIYHINRIKGKNHMVILTDKKKIHKIQHFHD